MNLICAIRRPAGILLWVVTIVLASLAAAVPAALATPRPPGWNKHPPVPPSPRPALRFPPGWNKHPPLPAHVHPLAAGAIPGWQLTLMAVTVVLLVAVVVAIAYPGPGRTVASARTRRLSDDPIRPAAAACRAGQAGPGPPRPSSPSPALGQG